MATPYDSAAGAGMFGDLYKQFAGMGMSPTGPQAYTNYNPMTGAGMGYLPSKGTVLGAMRKLYGTNELTSQMFNPISKMQMKGLKWDTYKPQLQQQQQNLLGSLLNTYNKGGQRKSSGGFAGSSNLDAYSKGVKDVYGKGMTESLGKVGDARASAYKGIQDTMQGWHQQAQAFVAGQ
tara:strand:+ start:89 stop:619 length:531 start_codon:yes stop_codon:yes gene_type:complete